MARFFRMTLLLAAAGLFATTAAFANIPDPNLSDVPGTVTITGDGSFGYTVIVRGPQGGVASANVELRFTATAGVFIPFCTGQSITLSATADGNGQATFFVAGGGCMPQDAWDNDLDLAGIAIGQVFADGIELARIDVNSPDVVDNGGFLAYEKPQFDPLGQNTVNISDAVFHTGPIVNQLAEFCSNFTEPFDDLVGIADATLVTGYILGAVGCTTPYVP